MKLTKTDAIEIYAYTQLCIGSILLLGLAYTYCRVRKLKNMSFMTKLLALMLLIALTDIYAGAILELSKYMTEATWDSFKLVNAVAYILYEISTILITWIVGFQFNDSAVKLETIETLLIEARHKKN